MGPCLSAPKPATDGPSVSARSARAFGVAPVRTAKSEGESSGEMVEVPLDTPLAAGSGAGRGSGFGSFLQAKVTVDSRSAEGPRDAPPEPSQGANGAAHRARGALVSERGRIDRALVDDTDAAVASALAGGDDEDADPESSAERVETRAEAEAAAARERDVSLELSGDPSDEETFSGSGEEPPEADKDDSTSAYASDASSASSAEEDEAGETPRSGPTERATSSDATDDALAVEPADEASEPGADASDESPMPIPGTPERGPADAAAEDDFEDSLETLDVDPVSDTEPDGSEFDSEASENADADEDDAADDADDDDDDADDADDADAADTETESRPSAEVSPEVSPESPHAPEPVADGSADSTASDVLDEDALGDRKTDLESLPRETRRLASEENAGAPEDDASDDSRDDSASSYASSAYSDEDDRFDADAGPRLASAVEAFGSTVDATVTEVRGAAEVLESGSLGATPRSARGGGALLSSRSGGSGSLSRSGGADSHRRGADSARSGASEGYTGVVVLYVTSVNAARRSAGQCRRVRLTLARLGVEFFERDVSMATAYEEELARRLAATMRDESGEDDADRARRAAGTEKEGKRTRTGEPPTSVGGTSSASSRDGSRLSRGELVVPCLFVDDALVGCGEALDASASDGSLRARLEERGRVGRARAAKDACAACAGRKLVLCDRCDGSMRWRMTDGKTGAVLGERRCPWCNEVGMRECAACVPAFAETTTRGNGGER